MGPARLTSGASGGGDGLYHKIATVAHILAQHVVPIFIAARYGKRPNPSSQRI